MEHEDLKKSKLTEEQTTFVLRQAESGTLIADVCRQLGVSEANFYVTFSARFGEVVRKSF